MHIKLRLYHLIGTLYMLGWARMPESGVVQVASTTGHDLVFSATAFDSCDESKCMSNVVPCHQ